MYTTIYTCPFGFSNFPLALSMRHISLCSPCSHSSDDPASMYAVLSNTESSINLFKERTLRSVHPCSQGSDGPALRYAASEVRRKRSFRFILSRNSQFFNQASTAHLVERLTSDLQTRVRFPAGEIFYKSEDT